MSSNMILLWFFAVWFSVIGLFFFAVAPDVIDCFAMTVQLQVDAVFSPNANVSGWC